MALQGRACRSAALPPIADEGEEEVGGTASRSVGGAMLEGPGVGGVCEGTGVKKEVRRTRGAATPSGAFKPKPVAGTCGPSSSRTVAVAASPSPSTALPEGRYGFASRSARPSMPCIWTNGNRA